MDPIEIVLGIILLLAAIFLIVAVLLQQGKNDGLSGAIGGSSSDTFFGKTKGKTMDKMLIKLTTIVGIAFVVIVLIVYVVQDDDASPFEVPEAEETVATTVADEKQTTPETAESSAPEETKASAEETK